MAYLDDILAKMDTIIADPEATQEQKDWAQSTKDNINGWSQDRKDRTNQARTKRYHSRMVISANSASA